MTLQEIADNSLFISREYRLSNKQKTNSTNTKKKHYITINCDTCGEQSTKTYQKNSWHFTCGKCVRGRKSTTQFISEAIAIHGTAYTYEETKYINNALPLIVTCPTHGPFYPRPVDVLAGTRCPVCAARSRSQVIPFHLVASSCTLYWIFFPKLKKYKLGLTSQPITKRFQSDLKGHLQWSEVMTYAQAVSYEHKMKRMFVAERYQGDTILLKGGGTYELFNRNTLPTFKTVKDLYDD